MPIVKFKFDNDLKVLQRDKWVQINNEVIDIVVVSGMDPKVHYPLIQKGPI